MGFRFRRSIKIAPGVRLNFSKTGVGASIGPRGLKVNLGADGKTRVSAGIPGTGFGYRETLTPNSRSDLERAPLKPVDLAILAGFILAILLLAVALL